LRHIDLRDRQWVCRCSHATYVATAPLWALLNRIAPAYATTTEKVGRAMIKVAREGYRKPVLESEDINAVSSVNP
jgi:hypothetical protein